MMTKSDFEAIASVYKAQVENLRTVRGLIEIGALTDTVTKPKAVTLETMAYNMVQKFYASNSRFDHKIFYAACGFEMVGNWPVVFPEDGNKV